MATGTKKETDSNAQKQQDTTDITRNDPALNYLPNPRQVPKGKLETSNTSRILFAEYFYRVMVPMTNWQYWITHLNNTKATIIKMPTSPMKMPL